MGVEVPTGYWIRGARGKRVRTTKKVTGCLSWTDQLGRGRKIDEDVTPVPRFSGDSKGTEVTTTKRTEMS